jgi:hypothetical protein
MGGGTGIHSRRIFIKRLVFEQDFLHRNRVLEDEDINSQTVGLIPLIFLKIPSKQQQIPGPWFVVYKSITIHGRL